MEKYARILFFIKNFSTFERSGKRVVRVAYCVFSGATAAIKILMARNSQRKSSLELATYCRAAIQKTQTWERKEERPQLSRWLPSRYFDKKITLEYGGREKLSFISQTLRPEIFFPLHLARSFCAMLKSILPLLQCDRNQMFRVPPRICHPILLSQTLWYGANIKPGIEFPIHFEDSVYRLGSPHKDVILQFRPGKKIWLAD